MIFRLKFYLYIGVIALLSACNTNQNSKTTEFTGGNKVVRIADVTIPSTIFPHRLTNSIEAIIAGQIHDGLVKTNPKDLKVEPGLAERWEISPNGKSVTFYLRKGVLFQDIGPLKGKNDEVTSKDVKFTFELLCTDRPGNVQFATVCKDRLVGANEYYKASSEGKKTELKGFKIIDDYTFSFDLLSPARVFIEILASPVAAIVSEDAYKVDKENVTVGCGPFIFDTKSSNKTHYALYKNPNYWAKDKEGNALPYIDSLIVDIVSSTEDALVKFKQGIYQFIGTVPGSQLKEIVETNIAEFKTSPPKYILDQRPEMVNSYYVFNINKAPANNIKVRQAISYAIDRNKIIEHALFGQAYGPGIYGVTPPTFDYYNIKQIKGYNLDIEKAKKLLAEAGYPNGKGFPELQLIVNSGNTRNNTVAAEIQKQLKTNLNINITFESLPNAEKFNLQIKGKGDMFRDAWVADFPSPETFLSVFYGGYVSKDTAHLAFPNTIKYINTEFDKNYEKGRNAIDRDSSAMYFLKAEQILMDEAPVLSLWYESNCRLISSTLHNFYTNPIRYFDFTRVKIDESKQDK
ncbi:MAG: ABC transporter substrate-binding protein [Bacteroidetes bacterium]|nr:ABC transporter substrate-binding protein [Bacteroidota bacterium]